MKKGAVLLVALALALFGLAACGDDDDEDGEDTAAVETTETEATGATGDTGAVSGGAAVALSTAPDAGIAYDQASLSAAAGPVTINYDNQASLSHDVVVADESGAELGKSDLVSQGETSVTVDLAPGTYTFFCDVSGHREGGMEGTLTVK